MILALLCAFAQPDLSAEASRRMKLNIDLDALQQRLATPAMDVAPAEPVLPTLPLEANSTLAAVTVFRDRAWVTRVRAVKLPAGANTVVFEGLPHAIVANGLTGTVTGGTARISGVELVAATGDVREAKRVDALRGEALRITNALGEVRDAIEALLAQRAYVRTTLLSDPTEGMDRPDLNRVRDTMTFVGTAERDLSRQLREQEVRAADLAEELEPLLLKIDQPAATGRQVRVQVQGTGGELTIGLRYQVTGAGWTPSYNARLVEKERVELEYFGVVRQNTREDWTDAELSLSTATALESRDLAVLEPWWLGRERGMDLDAGTGAVVQQSTVEPPEESRLVDSRMTAEVEGAVFRVPGRRTMKGDGSSQRIGLGAQVFTARVDYATVPKVVPSVIRRASIRYDGDVPMLPGTLNTFVGADYLGSGTTTAKVPGEALRLSFGTDDRLQVTRQLLSRRREFVGSGRRTTRYHFHFRIEVANLSKEARSVELYDQLPVSQLDKVVVRGDILTDGFRASTEGAPGVMVWDVNLPAGSTRTVDLRFTVTAPTEVADEQLQSMDLLF